MTLGTIRKNIEEVEEAARSIPGHGYFMRPAALVMPVDFESEPPRDDLGDVGPSRPELEFAPAVEPLVLGVIEAEQRGVGGALSLDVLMDVGWKWVEIGPFRFSRDELARLFTLLLVARQVMGQCSPKSTDPFSRVADGVAGPVTGKGSRP